MIAYKDGEHVRLISRNGGDHTKPFGDPAAAVAKLSARTLLFDGEVAIFDQQPRSRFDWLRDPDPDAVATPPLLMAFDVMYLDDCDLTQLLLRERLLLEAGKPISYVKEQLGHSTIQTTVDLYGHVKPGTARRWTDWRC